MSQRTSLSTSQTADLPRGGRARPRRLGFFRGAVLLLIAALVGVFQPDCFRFAVRHFLRFEAWRNDVDARIGSVGGSVFEPVVVRDSVWSYESEKGPVTRVEIKTATATFAWRNLLPRGSGKWFERLALEGVTGKVRLPLAAENRPPRAPFFALRLPRPHGRWLAAPERFSAADVDFIFQSNGDYVRLAQAALTLSEVETGEISAGQIVVRQPWLTHTFRHVAGTTAIQDGTLQFAGLKLEPGVRVQDFSASLADFAQGRVKFAVKLAAFGGDLRADVQTLPDEPQFSIDVAVPFTRIDVARLATFLGVSEAAGGTIKTGRFSFRGPPQQFAKASAELRIEAANFQWETRQWDSLVLGAKLLGGRVQIPELALAQGHNRLALSGEMALPMPGVAWWRSEFSCDLAAQIDNLTELSALLLPEFKFAAGRGNIDGSIRGKDQKFTGQILVSGSNLRWRNAPLEELHASVKLNGNEYQITNFSLFNDGDFVRGRGVVNIIGDKQYWGELHGSVQDLAQYAAILQKPIVPEPLAGGALLDWNGEGSARGHSGTFFAHLRKVRSLGATAALLHPINADFEGSYSNGGMVFSNFTLSDDDSSFTAHVGVVNKAVSLQGIRLMHRQTLWLEGDALLPLDVWNAWPNTSLATLLDDRTVSRVALTAYDLSLHEAAQLTGLKFPIEGFVRGNLRAEGPLGALQTSGALTLSKARLPLGWSGAALTAVEGAATLDGQILHLEKLTGQHSAGDFSASGEIDFTNLRDPSVQLAMTSTASRLRLFSDAEENGGIGCEAALALHLAGPLSAGKVSGEARVQSAAAAGPAAALWDEWLLGDRVEELPPVLTVAGAPWKNWQCDVHALAEKIALGSLTLDADLRLTGALAAPELVGGAALHFTKEVNPSRGLPLHLPIAPAPPTALTALQIALDFREGFPRAPVVSAEASGSVGDEPFALYLTGTPPAPMRVFVSAPPLTEKAIRAELSGGRAARFFSAESRFSLLVPAELREGAEMSDWPEIKAPSASPVDATAVENPPAPPNGAPQ